MIMADKNALISVGKIVAPHGVRGDVRVIPLTDFPERFNLLKKVRLSGGKLVEIEKVRYHKQFVLLKFCGLDNKNDVEPLRGQLLLIPREELMPLPEGHYYIFDIIGLSVYNQEQEKLGVVTDVLQTGSNDVYVIESPGKPPLLIPALKTVVLKVDIAGGYMVVQPPQEWE